MSNISLKITSSVFLLFLAVFLSSCSSLNSSLQGSSSRTSAEEIGGFVGGIKGLDITLVDGTPPNVIQDAGLTPFSFIVALENSGEARVGQGTHNPLLFVRLAGILHSNFDLSEEEIIKVYDSKLEPAKRNFDGTIIPGEITHISYEDLNYLPDVFDSLVMTMRAEVCYDYESYASVKFCMKSDLVEHVEDSTLCNLNGPRPFGNSGAPLQITRVEQAPINGQTVQINFVIEHLGNGIFFDRHVYTDLFNVCVFDDTNPHIYKTRVVVEPLQKDQYDVECLRLDEELPGGGAAGSVRLFRGAPVTITCFIHAQEELGSRVRQDLLDITLQYRYGDYIEQPILIQGHP